VVRGSGPAVLSSRGRGELLPPAVPAKQSSRGSGTERHYSRSPVSRVPCRPCCLLLSRERSPPCDAAAVPCTGVARFASSCLPICPLARPFCSRARTWFVENILLQIQETLQEDCKSMYQLDLLHREVFSHLHLHPAINRKTYPRDIILEPVSEPLGGVADHRTSLSLFRLFFSVFFEMVRHRLYSKVRVRSFPPYPLSIYGCPKPCKRWAPLVAIVI
jgi:hypothetical protein